MAKIESGREVVKFDGLMTSRRTSQSLRQSSPTNTQRDVRLRQFR